MFRKWLLIGAVVFAAIGVSAVDAEARGPRHGGLHRAARPHLHHPGHHHHRHHHHRHHHYRHHGFHPGPGVGLYGPGYYRAARPSLGISIGAPTYRYNPYRGVTPYYVRPSSGFSLYIGR